MLPLDLSHGSDHLLTRLAGQTTSSPVSFATGFSSRCQAHPSVRGGRCSILWSPPGTEPPLQPSEGARCVYITCVCVMSALCVCDGCTVCV